MNGNISQAVQLQINKLRNLPALPEASVSILQAINDPDIEIEQLVRVVSLSPGLVARLLGLANSAFFGQARPIDDLHTAIVRVLGLQLVKSLILGILLNVKLDPKACKNFDSQSFWMHSLLTAVAAQKLSQSHGWRDLSAANAYTGGLLLHIGLLVTAFLFPQELSGILDGQPKSYLQVADEIQSHFGQSHYQMGYMLLKKWGLPAIYQTMLLEFESDGGTSELNRCLHASQRICYLMDDPEVQEAGITAIAEQSGLPQEAVLKVFTVLLEHKNNIQKLASELGSQ